MINKIMLAKIRSILVEDEIVKIKGIIKIEDVVPDCIGSDTLSIDTNFIPIVKEGNHSTPKIIQDLEEYVNTSLSLKGNKQIKVKLI